MTTLLPSYITLNHKSNFVSLIKIHLLLGLWLLVSINLWGQQPIDLDYSKEYQYKLAPDFFEKKSNHSYQQLVRKAQVEVTFVQEYPAYNCIVLTTNRVDFLQHLLNAPIVLFADLRNGLPQEERAIDNLDLSVNRINQIHHQFPELNGSDRTISLKENRPDSSDIDFQNRYVPSELSALAVSTHATNMATMMLGAGNSSPFGKGGGVTSKNFSQ